VKGGGTKGRARSVCKRTIHRHAAKQLTFRKKRKRRKFEVKNKKRGLSGSIELERQFLTKERMLKTKGTPDKGVILKRGEKKGQRDFLSKLEAERELPERNGT